MTETWTSRSGLRFSHRMMAHPEPDMTPTLFVSGAFQTMSSWARFARAFGRRTTVLLVDPPGMGESDLLPSAVGVEFLAECLEQVLDERGVERVSVVAASYGTPAAFEFARRCGDRIDRLVLAGTAPALPDRHLDDIRVSLELARRGARERIAELAVATMLCHATDRPVDRLDAAARILRTGILRMTDAELMKYVANTERLLNHPPLELQPSIAGPDVLVMTGEYDTFTPPEQGRVVAAAFEHAWFTTVRRSDHLLHLEQWPTVIELFLRFIGGDLPADGIDGCNALEVVRAPHLRAPDPEPAI